MNRNRVPESEGEYSSSSSDEEELANRFKYRLKMDQQLGPSPLTPDKRKAMEDAQGSTSGVTDGSRSYYRSDGASSSSRIPYEYTPHLDNFGNSILNLDCAIDESKELDTWISTMSRNLMALNLNGYQTYTYLLNSTTGTVRHFLIKRFGNLSANEWESLASDAVLGKIGEIITAEFFGKIKRIPQDARNMAEEAMNHLIRIQICDLCEIDSYICEYKTYYYQLNDDQQKMFNKMFYSKLPTPINSHMERIYQEAIRGLVDPPQPPMNHLSPHVDTLGRRIRYLKEEIARMCTERTKNVLMKPVTKACCDKNPRVPGNYGCDTVYRRKHKYRHKKHRKYRKHRHYKPRFTRTKGKYYRRSNNFKRRRYYRKKTVINTTNPTCPRGKTSCRCWICNEQGHYANECPNKQEKKYKEQNKVLEQIFSLGYEPIEDSDISDKEEIYYIESDSDESSETTEESSQESSSESEEERPKISRRRRS